MKPSAKEVIVTICLGIANLLGSIIVLVAAGFVARITFELIKWGWTGFGG